jgi:outer membrane lipoprotein-sorting protein
MRFWSSAIMLLVTCSISAAPATKEVQLSELQSRLRLYTGYKAFETKFNQVKFIKSMNVHLKSKGRLTVEKPNKVLWQITEPSLMTVKIDDKNLEMTTGTGKEANIQKVDIGNVPSAMKNMAMLSTWLRLDAEELARDYKISKISDLQFNFEPREEGMFTGFEMTLTPKGHLKSLIIHEKSEDTLQIEFEIPKFQARSN